jgi:hypothetical protein
MPKGANGVTESALKQIKEDVKNSTAPGETLIDRFIDSEADGTSPLGEGGVVMPRHQEVKLYLEAHPDMADVTQTLCITARQEFGIEASLSLEVYRDPEIEDEHLVIYVRLPSYDHETMSRINSVADKCEASLEHVTGMLLLTTDFRPTR